MYAVGSLILYGRTGACRVEGIAEQALRGEKSARLFYILRPLYQNGTIAAPVENVDNGMLSSRPIMSRDEAQAFIEQLPTLDAEPYHNRNLTQLREHYRQQFGNLASRDLALLICSIYRKKKEAQAMNRKMGAVDEKFMNEAENLLYGELAAALDIPREGVQEYIDAALRGKCTDLQEN